MVKRIAIVGAGIMGRTLAWQLLNQKRPVEISIFDQDPINKGCAAAYTAAGMLSPYSELESTELNLFLMGLASLKRWPVVIASLRRQTQTQVSFFNQGTLVVAHHQDHADYQRVTLQIRSKLADLVQDEIGLHLHELNQSELRQLAPQLAVRFASGLHLPHEAWVDSNQIMAALSKCLLNSGVDWQPNCQVIRIENCIQANQRLGAAVCLTTETQLFDHVVDCRGMGAKQDINGLRGVRGEVITLYAPQVDLKHAVRLMHPRYKLYIAPRDDQHFVIGASQIESEDTGPLSVRSALELLSAAYSIDSGFAEARIVNSAANCRPAFQDNLPKIICDKQVISVNGLFRHGYLLAPIVAEQASERIFNPTFISSFPQLIQEL